MPLSGLATSSTGTRSWVNTLVLSLTRSPECRAPPRPTKGTLPGGPPANRQGDYTPARRGQFGPRQGTWAKLASCWPELCRARLGAARPQARGAGTPGDGKTKTRRSRRDHRRRRHGGGPGAPAGPATLEPSESLARVQGRRAGASPRAAQLPSPPISLVRPPQSRLLGRPQGSSPGDMLSSEATQPCPHTGCGWRLLKAAGLRSPTSVPLPVLTTGPARRRANEWPHLPGAWRAQRDPPRTDGGGTGPSLFFSASPQIQSLRFNLVSGYKGHISLQC